MELEELKQRIKSKAFKSTVCGQVYRFLSGDMLAVNNHRAYYDIRVDKNCFVLEHSSLLGNENLILEVETLKYPMTITLFKRSNLDFFTTFIEE